MNQAKFTAPCYKCGAKTIDNFCHDCNAHRRRYIVKPLPKQEAPKRAKVDKKEANFLKAKKRYAAKWHSMSEGEDPFWLGFFAAELGDEYGDKSIGLRLIELDLETL